LSHGFFFQWYLITCFEVSLLHCYKRFDSNCLNIFPSVLFKQPADCLKHRKIHIYGKFDHFLDALAHNSVVLAVEVKIYVHEEINCFQHINLVVSLPWKYAVALYSKINIRKSFIVAHIEISKFDKLIH